MYPGVELRLLRYVSVLAQELNFTRASARLHVAQPSLSKQIRELEDYLGLKLFERTKREVRLTAAGEAFAIEARQAILYAERAVQGARAASGQHRGRWTIAYSPLIDMRILSKVRQHLSVSHPAADIRLVSAYTSEQAEALMGGSLQAGLVIFPVREAGLTCQGLHREALILALPAGHRLAGKAEVELTDLDETPLITMRGDFEPRFGEDLNRIFRLTRVRLLISHEATTQTEALQLASESGLAALLMPSARQSARDGIVFRRFLDEVLTAETGLAYVGGNGSAILQSLRKFLMETFQPLPPSGAGLATDGRTRQMTLF